jgi:pimeloyl-ACP methyl ester carboxylesterase
MPIAVKTLAKVLLPFALLGAATLSHAAGDEKGRAIVKDLSRIVSPKGVQENYKLHIGGIDQWIFARGQDSDNPVILFVHGGPASPSAPTMWTWQRPLEEYFTVVNYDQRGAGKTYLESSPDAVRDSLHIASFVDDAVEIAEQVAKRYGKKKVILMGHSWGTIVAMQAALKRPDLFYAYVGVGQTINVMDNERVSFEFALDQARKTGNAEATKELEAIAPYPGNTPITRERIIAARKWAQYYGGLAAYRHDFSYYFDAPKLSPEYDDKADAAIDEGNMLTLGAILPEFMAVDMKPVKQFPIPVLMFMGRHDFTTPSEPTAQWLDKVKAPYKRGVWFENASHLLQFEEPGKVLVSMLNYVRPFAVDGGDKTAMLGQAVKTQN